jgi:phage shock protein PspC (stress-responsive transcriptional regulator)
MIWGIALVAAGIGIFFAMPQKVVQLQQMQVSSFFINFTRFSFYLIAVLLIGGGARKIYENYQKRDSK